MAYVKATLQLTSSQIPTCAHPYLTSVLDSWNYTGYITSDTDAIMDIWKTHKYTKTEEEAACKAIVDGR